MKNLSKLNRQSLLPGLQETLLIIVLSICRINISAQPTLAVHTDAEKNNASQELSLKTAFSGSYRLGNNEFQAGVRTNLMNSNNIVLSGSFLKASRQFKIGSVPLALNGFWMWTASSDLLKETNYGCSVFMKQNHFEILLGTNFRTIAFRNKAIDIYRIDESNTKVHENFNLMYSFCYNLKSPSSSWNAGLTITNTDYFLINQETNPYMNLHGSYRISTPVTLFAEAWYKTSGALNMAVNNFGYTFRFGIIWKIL